METDTIDKSPLPPRPCHQFRPRRLDLPPRLVGVGVGASYLCSSIGRTPDQKTFCLVGKMSLSGNLEMRVRLPPEVLVFQTEDAHRLVKRPAVAGHDPAQNVV